MSNDNATPLAANVYDQEIENTIPYYQEFYNQTLDIVEQYHSSSIKWLDLGCGTGTLEEIARQRFSDIQFTLVDPSEKMLEQAKKKLKDDSIQYLCSDSASIHFIDCFDIVTASHQPPLQVGVCQRPPKGPLILARLKGGCRKLFYWLPLKSGSFTIFFS